MSFPDMRRYARHMIEVENEAMSMDMVHLQAMWAVIADARPKTIIEVGSYRGGSACLLVEALRQGLTSAVHLFEPYPRRELLDLIAMSETPERIVLHKQSYYDFPMHADYILIDGDHRWHALADVLGAVIRQCGIIAMHDSMGFVKGGYGDCWGSWAAANILRQADGYDIFEDSKRRVGQRTERGLMIARRNTP